MTSYNTEGIDALQQLIGENYRLQWIVGHGGMSTVWLADDLRRNREVAIKVLKPEFSDNQEFLSRFRNEAHTVEQIQHPNVVATYDYSELTDDRGRQFCYIVMEFIRGESLADLLAREGKLSEDRALGIIEQAAHGLATIHAMNLVHRDIKPGNIMITPDDRVKITDFGIAKAAAAVPLTRTGMVVGTAQYVSPEQAQGQQVTAASDVYSLGVVGFELLSGNRPFTGDSSVSVAISHIRDAAPSLDVSVSAPARELIAIALRKDPARRFAEGGAFAAAVSQVRLGRRPQDPSPTPMAEPHYAPTDTATTVMPVGTPAEVLKSSTSEEPQKSSKGGWIAAAALVALIAAGGGAYAFLAGGKDSAPTPTPAPVTVHVTTPATSSAPVVTQPPSTRPKKTTSPAQPTTIYETSEPAPESTPTQQAPTSASKPTRTQAPRTTEPRVSVPEEPLPTETVELEIPNLPSLFNNG